MSGRAANAGRDTTPRSGPSRPPRPARLARGPSTSAGSPRNKPLDPAAAASPTAIASSARVFEVSPTDPLTLGAAAGLLLVVGLLATLNPTRRAARVDPMQALRAE